MNTALNALFVVALLFAALIFWQALMSFYDRRRFPPPSSRINGLYYRLMGEGNITVVFDAGAGGWSDDWCLVAPEVAKFARVLVYDRAGYGWSESGILPRDARQCAMELKTLLDGAAIPPPYLLVGHSIAGLNLQAFTALYPETVAGLVLVDISDRLTIREQLERYLPETEREPTLKQFIRFYGDPAPHPLYKLLRIVIPALGMTRLFGERLMRQLPVYSVLPPDERRRNRALFWQSNTMRTLLDEGQMLEASAAQVREMLPDFGNLPVTVLTADTPGGKRYTKAMPEKLMPLARLRRQVQSELAALSSRGQHRVIAQSQHFIHIDQPQAVIEAIHETLMDKTSNL